MPLRMNPLMKNEHCLRMLRIRSASVQVKSTLASAMPACFASKPMACVSTPRVLSFLSLTLMDGCESLSLVARSCCEMSGSFMRSESSLVSLSSMPILSLSIVCGKSGWSIKGFL